MRRAWFVSTCAAIVGILLGPLGCSWLFPTTTDGTGTDEPLAVSAPDVQVTADVGQTTAQVCPQVAATSQCGQATVSATRSDLLDTCADPYPVGQTQVTWTATDACNNQQSTTQTITVLPLNTCRVRIALDGGVAAAITRNVTFSFWYCGAAATEVDADLQFVSGVAEADVQVPVGAQSYTCVTARDKLHTLRRTLDSVPVVSGKYVADFVAAGKPLIGGNLNDDDWIDVLDFGIYVFQFGTQYASGNTPRGTAAPNADVNGDGVAWVEDFTFTSLGYLQGSEANCCGAASTGGANPITSITTAELAALGLGYLGAADISGDGTVNADDIAAFQQQHPR